MGIVRVSTGVGGWASTAALRGRVLRPGVRHKFKFCDSYWLLVSGRKSDTYMKNYVSLIVLQTVSLLHATAAGENVEENATT